MIGNHSHANKDASNSLEEDGSCDFMNRCGYLKWRPDCLQRFRNIYLFLVTMSFVCLLQTALSVGYLSSQITTLERRFSLDSYMLGFIQSFFEVGFITSVIFVGYFGGGGRIPFWIAFGMLIMSTGAFVFTLPQFISDYSDRSSIGIEKTAMCTASNASKTEIICRNDSKSNVQVKVLFIVGQILIGCGSSPILSLAPTYVDDHVPGTLAFPLIASLYASSALGPVLGFGLGALVLQYSAVGDTSPGSKPGDHNWIGAWWIGYVCLGILAGSSSIFLFLFPRRVRKITKSKVKPLLQFSEKSLEEMHATEKHNGGTILSDNESNRINNERSTQIIQENKFKKYGTDIKDMPKAISSLLRNKVYVVVNLAICFEMFLINGLAAFLPKYIESEYKLSNVTASLLVGGLVVPAAVIGILAGGLIMRRFIKTLRNAVLFSFVSVLLVLLLIILFFIFSCQSPPFAGINTAIYYNDTKSNLDISNQCQKEACSNSCDRNQYSPVCDTNSSVTFFSACYAGCNRFSSDESNKKYFFNCSCTRINENATGSTMLTEGECPLQCNSLVSFLALLTLAIFFIAITQNPLLMVTIRSVANQERSFALGLQFVILRLLAYIPSPIIYGGAIDAACVHWKITCGERGDCLVTDLKLLSLYVIGLSFAVKCGSACFYIILYFLIPKNATADTGSSNKDVGCQC